MTPNDTRWRPAAYAIVTACFFLQGSFVWADAGDSIPEPTLSADALAGQAVWRDHNCQSCHAIYGYGGFLGPDLTNAASRLPRSHFDAVLQNGAGRMPDFHLDAGDRAGVVAWLREVDRTGLGTVRAPGRLGATDAPDAVAEGAALVAARGCAGCHEGGVGPDLRQAALRLGVEGIVVWLREPRGKMPAVDLTLEQRVAVAEYLAWYAEQGDVEVVEAWEVPWFTYTR